MINVEAQRASLQGRGILITRPAEQAAALARQLELHGARTIRFPAIAITQAEDAVSMNRILDRLAEFDVAIFISPNAAKRGLHAVLSRGPLPGNLQIVAIGSATARELERGGASQVTVPQGRFDSEALLELPALGDVRGKRIVIFRGEGGRAMLGDTLRARGSHVEYAECYRRAKPNVDAAPVLRAWSRGEIDGCVATSSEGLRNFLQMIGTAGATQLATTPLFVPHPRIGATARELGLKAVVVTPPADEGLVEGILGYFGRR